MKSNLKPHACELMIIGAGMTGMAAALCASHRGIDTVQAGLTGETMYASGLFDLYGVAHQTTLPIDDPWQGLRALRRDQPRHPFSRLTVGQIRRAMDRLTAFLGDAGLAYTGYADKNARLITCVGTIKRTFRVPATAWAGVKALEEKSSCLIVDIQGLRGFSARQIVSTLKPAWPDLQAASIELAWENRLGPKYAEHIARGLEVEAARQELGDAIRPHLGRSRYVGLPAVLGIHDTAGVHADLQRMLKRPVFEIPTMPPAVAGIRLKEIFEDHIPRLGVRTYLHHSVMALRSRCDGRFEIDVGKTAPETTVIADHVLLATGRFLGKGLVADRQGIREAIMNLPVHQPENRTCWHRMPSTWRA